MPSQDILHSILVCFGPSLICWLHRCSDAEFREFGATGARVQLDRATGRSRGFGFVMFADEKGLREAIAAMDKTDVDGRRISVTRAIPQNETAPGTPAAALQRGARGGALALAAHPFFQALVASGQPSHRVLIVSLAMCPPYSGG